MLFVTDCSYFPYNIKNLNHILIEANYSDEILIENLSNDDISRSLYQYHLEINDTIDVLTRNFSKDLQSVLLLHLSGMNADAISFVHKVQDTLGFNNVLVAQKGLVIPLVKEEF